MLLRDTKLIYCFLNFQVFNFHPMGCIKFYVVILFFVCMMYGW